MSINSEEDIVEKQSEFLDALKNNFLYELLIYIFNSIDLNNNDSIYNNLKKKSSKNYSSRLSIHIVNTKLRNSIPSLYI
jgi:hypothetical protein